MSPSTFVKRHNRPSPNNYDQRGRVIKQIEGPADETLSPSDVDEAWSRQAPGASRRGTRSPGRRHQQITLTTVSSWRGELWAFDTRLKAETKAPPPPCSVCADAVRNQHKSLMGNFSTPAPAAAAVRHAGPTVVDATTTRRTERPISRRAARIYQMSSVCQRRPDMVRLPTLSTLSFQTVEMCINGDGGRRR